MNTFLKLFLAIATIISFGACESGNGVFDATDDEQGATDETTSTVDPPAATTPTETETPKKVYGDLDGDGFSPALGNDCDETNPAVNKYAVEICDGIDNNCDGHADEGLTEEVYFDGDKDGYGLSKEVTTVCIGAEVPKGYSAHGGDCNDSAKDANSDGKVDGFWLNQDATETCDDDIDNDCDGKTDEGCAPRESFDDLLLGDNFALVVSWPSEKMGQKIMAVPYYAQADIGKDWVWFQESINNIVFTLVPDGNACGVRFNTAHGKPASEWLCMDDKINPDAVIFVVKGDGSILDVTKLVKKWPAPEGGCSVNLEIHDCK
jgi:hypothetical protein